jgi:glycosyltransferase involved in cell wall biosynthesis
MKAAAPLSVCVIARDEEDVLSRCLDSVAWADEIVAVVDARSRDGSEKIAREHTSRVEVRAYSGDIDQKRHCVERATHDWVMIVDPDEVVSEELAAEIQECLAAPQGAVAGYRVNRLSFHLGRWIRHGDFYPDWKLRVFRKSACRWEGRDPHGRVEVDGIVASLEGELAHYSYRDLADQLDRIQFFSAEAAAALDAEGHPARIRDMVLRPPARFARAYWLKRGFLDGVPGFVIAAATAFHVFLKYAKLWELQRVEPRRESADETRDETRDEAR